MACQDNAPGENDSELPIAGADLLQQQVTGNFEYDVTDLTEVSDRGRYTQLHLRNILTAPNYIRRASF